MVVVVMVMIVIIVVIIVVVVMVVMVVLFVVVVMVVLVVAVLLLAVHGHGDVGAGDAALHGALALKAHARDAQAVHAGDEVVGPVDQLRQRGHQHVPRRAHVAFDV